MEFVLYHYVKNVLILFYDCIVVHGMNVPGYVFKIVLYWLRETFPVILSKLLVHMAWPGAAKGRMPVQRLGGPQVQIMNGIGLDGSEWQRQRAELVEPHARWRSLAKGHLCLICHSPDGPHFKAEALTFIYTWLRKGFSRGPVRGSDVSYTFWQEVEGCQKVSDLIKLIQSEKELCVCLETSTCLPVEGMWWTSQSISCWTSSFLVVLSR